MNVLVIEDELSAYNNIKRLIKNSADKGLTIIKWLSNVEDTIKWFETNAQPDLILLDIHLSDGISFAIFDQVEIKSMIVFTTAYSEYAIKAFDFNTINYLMKPISQEDFDKVIRKARTHDNLTQFNSQLLKNLKSYNFEGYKQRLLVKKKDALIAVNTKDIAFINIINSVILETKTSERYIINYTLDELMAILDPKMFYRCNRQYIVNIDSIKEVQPYHNYSLKVVLYNSVDSSIIINKDKVKQFKEWIDT